MDVLAISASEVVVLSGCEMFYFGEGLDERAIAGMNEQPLKLECLGKRCSNFTTRAKEIIDSMIQASGAVTDIRALYYAMEMSNVEFRLILGKTVRDLHKANPLHSLDLSNNHLTVIPSCISMMSDLNTLNLSNNGIKDLYDVSGCWGGPPTGIPLSIKEKTKRQCYWFWSSRKSLRVLDLSHNLIEYLGQVEPWYQVNLETLDLSYNRLAVLGTDSFTGSLASSLNRIFIQNNHLKTVNLTCLSKAIRINAANNQISCIKRDTLPSSRSMRSIHLEGNLISSIASSAFTNYPILEKIDLSKNMLEYMPFDSFKTTQRHAPSDRVEVSIAKQKTTIVCNCQHFFLSTMLEEQSDNHTYKMPTIATKERQKTECRLLPRSLGGRRNVTKMFAALHLNDFGCELRDSSRIELPVSVCKRKNGTCIGKCNPKCYCWSNAIKTIMNCSVRGIPNSARNIPMPITVLDFSHMTTSFIQAFCNDTITWKFDEDRFSLKEFRAQQSNIVTIADYAFAKTPEVTKIIVPHNRIKQLNERTFAGLEHSLSHLDLRHNNLTMVSVKRVFDPLLALGTVELFGNPFVCGCSPIHLNYLKEMAQYDGVKSVINDYRQLTCNLTDEFVTDFNFYNLSFVKTNFTLSSFPMHSVTLLKKMCKDIDKQKAQLKLKILQTTLSTISIAAGLIITALLVRRRHFVQSMIMHVVITHLVKPRRYRGDESFHVFFYFDDSDSDIASEILKHLNKPPTEIPGSRGIVVRHSGEQAPSEELATKAESIPYFVQRSVKVLVLLSTELMQSNTNEIRLITGELGNLRMARDLILITADRQDEMKMQLSHLQETFRTNQERKGMELWMRLLTRGHTIRYGSRDWQYHLMNKILRGLPWLPRSFVPNHGGVNEFDSLLLKNSSGYDELEMSGHRPLLNTF
ncbi:hypothetical protein BOX15_Mlig030947g1 [Macrostomum lignano]|uniref:TIR domain-containing protein n=1 Tax=Macrostomum lignano TaxID=282301 RepID=A0A267H7C3_9PLAT|nr:hypothetical protein BOX15_Mlig030947g1 [Macrostomum lignano]